MCSLCLLGILLPVICFLSFIIFFLTSINSYGLPRNWPLLGMLPDLLFNVHRFHSWCTNLLQISHCNFLFKGPWFCNMDICITADPSNVHYIMSSNFSNFPKGPEFKRIFDVLGDGIFNADSDLWKNQRKSAHAVINSQNFYQFLVKTTQDKVEKCMVPVIEHALKQGMVVDLQDLFKRFTFDTTCILVSGYDPHCLSIDFPENAFSNAMDDVEEALFYRHVVPESIWSLQRLLAIGKEKKLKKAWSTLDHNLAQIISSKRQQLGNKSSAKFDLLSTYMNTESDKDLRDKIMNFMIAGRSTTSSALSWFFYLIFENPKVETKIIDELKSTIPTKTEQESFRLFKIEELKGLVYLHGALCETLRLYPPVPFENKTPIEQDELPSGDHAIPKTKIIINLYAMGRLESIWGQDCLEFKPERWISERGKIKHEPSYKFMAFNAGPRTCLGKEVALTQMKAAVASILYNYHVQVVEEQIVAPSISIILHMKHGMKVYLKNRWT